MLSRIPHPLQRPPPLYPRARRLMHEFRHRLRRTVPGNPYECPEAFWSFVSGTIRQRRYIFSLILKWWISAAVEGRGIRWSRASPLSRSVFIVPCFCFFFFFRFAFRLPICLLSFLDTVLISFSYNYRWMIIHRVHFFFEMYHRLERDYDDIRELLKCHHVSFSKYLEISRSIK